MTPPFYGDLGENIHYYPADTSLMNTLQLIVSKLKSQHVKSHLMCTLPTVLHLRMYSSADHGPCIPPTPSESRDIIPFCEVGTGPMHHGAGGKLPLHFYATPSSTL